MGDLFNDILKWLVDTVLGIFDLIREELQAEVKQEEERLQQEIAEFREQYEESKINLAVRIEEAKHSIHFEACTSAWHKSVVTANLAYRIKTQTNKVNSIYRSALNRTNEEILKAKKERDGLRRESDARNNKHKEYESGIALKDNIIRSMKLNQQKEDEIFVEVRSLNRNTEELRELITTNFGNRGLQWRARLDERTAKRKAL